MGWFSVVQCAGDTIGDDLTCISERREAREKMLIREEAVAAMTIESWFPNLSHCSQTEGCCELLLLLRGYKMGTYDQPLTHRNLPDRLEGSVCRPLANSERSLQSRQRVEREGCR
jgi:hypothetical protein